MNLLKKNFAYIRHAFSMTISNIPRLLLSISGLLVGLVVLGVGSILLDTYYNELKQKAEEYSETSVIINVEAKDDIITDIVSNIDNSNVCKYLINDRKETICYNSYSNGFQIIMNAGIIGATPNIGDSVLMEYDNNTIIPIKANLIDGRWITGQDLVSNRKVVVIDDFTAKMLFGTTECIGNIIEFGVENNGAVAVSDETSNEKQHQKFEIIGVFTNDVLTADNFFQYKKFLKQGTSNLILDTKVYIPLSTYKEIYNVAEINKYMLEWNDQNNLNSIKDKLCENEIKFSDDSEIFKIITRETTLKDLEMEIKPVKIFLFVILGILFVISGINSMNIMFFSIKERIGEIGIKKAMGATKSDIILQFLLEGLFTSYLAGILAIMLSGLISKVIGNYIENKLFMSFNVTFTLQPFVLIFIVASIYGIIFSLVPSYMGAKSKVTDSLRFE